LIDRARSALTGEETLAELAVRRARVASLTGDNTRALQESEVALSIADPRGLRPLFAEAAITRANALQYHGRVLEAMSLQALGLQVALDADVTDQALRGFFNLAEFHLVVGHPEESGALLDRGLAMARERGNRSWERDLFAQRIGVHAFCGEWDQALALSAETRTAGETGIVRLAAVFAPLILAARGDASGLETWLAQPVEPSEWHELAVIESIARAVALRATGEVDEATRLIVEVAPEESVLGGLTHVYYIGEVLDALISAEQLTLVEELLANSAHDELPVTRAQLQRARGRLLARSGELSDAETSLAQAATTLRDAGNPFELARTLLDDAGVLLELGRTGEANAVLQKASSLFAKLGATPWLERTKRLLDPAAIATE
jgi:tetratricopeptide (TPR) repeat protein